MGLMPLWKERKAWDLSLFVHVPRKDHLRALKLGRGPSPWIWPCWLHDLELQSSRTVRKIKNIYYLSHWAYGICYGSRSRLRLCSWLYSTKVATSIYFFHGTCSSYNVTVVPSDEMWSLCPFLSGSQRTVTIPIHRVRQKWCCMRLGHREDQLPLGTLSFRMLVRESWPYGEADMGRNWALCAAGSTDSRHMSETSWKWVLQLHARL